MASSLQTSPPCALDPLLYVGSPDKRGGGYLSQASPHLEIGGRIDEPSLLNSRAFDDTFVAVVFFNLGGYGWVEGLWSVGELSAEMVAKMLYRARRWCGRNMVRKLVNLFDQSQMMTDVFGLVGCFRSPSENG